MPRCTFLDGATQQVIEGLNFGGSPQVVYDVGGVLVYAPIGGTDITIADNVATLNPLGLTSGNALGNWNIISETDKGTCEWKLNLQNASTAEVKNGVYPFNTVDGITYELECQAGVWVMATCGGYEIESTWVGQLANECYRLKGTNEIISAQYEYLGAIDDVCEPLCADGFYFDCVSGTCVAYSSFTITPIRSGGEVIEVSAVSSINGGVLTETYYQEDWHDWDWAKSSANFNIPSRTVATLAELDTFVTLGDCSTGGGFLGSEHIYEMTTSSPFVCNNNIIDFTRDAFFIDAPVGVYTYPDTWMDRNDSAEYGQYYLTSCRWIVQCTITYNI
jgi:hypothetical protein